MAVAEESKEQALREQVKDLKAQLNAASGARDQLSKDLGAAHKEIAAGAALAAENARLEAALAARGAEVSNLSAALKSATSKLDKAEAVLAAGKAIKDGLALLG